MAEASLTNTYLDPETRERLRKRYMEGVQPQARAATDVATSTINPAMRGRVGASLLREVQSPITQGLAGLETGMEEKGAGYAADLPFRMAPYTGMLGGQQTEQARAQRQGERFTEAGLTGMLGAEETKTPAELAAMTPGERTAYENRMHYAQRPTLAKTGQEQNWQATLAGLLGRISTPTGTFETMPGAEFKRGEREQEDLDAMARNVGYPSYAAYLTAKASGAAVGQLNKPPAEAYDRQIRTKPVGWGY